MSGDLQAVMVRIPREQLEELQRHSAENDRTVSQTIRRAVRLYLQNTAQEEAP